MSFSSPGFLFAFFPMIFLAYNAVPVVARNAVLLISSLAFYSIDGGYITAVLIASIGVNQTTGKLIKSIQNNAARSMVLWVGVTLNLLPLIYYKYWTFLNGVAHDALSLVGAPSWQAHSNILLPAGISFFTFQGLSYLIDIKRGDVEPARGFVDFGMYHSLFPQLIAGPIVRFVEVRDRVQIRPIQLSEVQSGILRFCWGLSKKMIVADSMGSVADRMFALQPDELSATAAWIGALAYTLQIYFDFSGYTDMAIGLGKMLGFHFPENFDLPYRSLSITEFWRRWHMTLSRWFRDYLYIPLGGNRCGPARTHFNLFLVFVLCGLWHGAAYTFLTWGCYHGALLVAERAAGRQRRIPIALAWTTTMLLIVVGWVIFRSTSLSAASSYLSAMAGFGASSDSAGALAVVTPDKLVVFALGAFLATMPIGGLALNPAKAMIGFPPVAVERGFALLAFVYSCAIIAANGFNPFIYFRF